MAQRGSDCTLVKVKICIQIHDCKVRNVDSLDYETLPIHSSDLAQ